MNKTGRVYHNARLAGRIEYTGTEYVFRYDPAYLADPSTPPIALSLPKTAKEFRSPVLFPFFFGLLAEGANRDLQCAVLKIDPADHFTRLLRTAGENTIGAITVRGEE
jgi:HipA-like protein